ncbi:autophagy-related protein 2 homolog A-like isoform X2 [Amphibalanus amphitrite]|uniref:autophagy-related protein 2 homolog A-like isoform X2 n=1 Tax=Amphibalanus amphitrite TaxID=1232801 RepID=UPI001C905B7A|nr:autophagy-related protein 2 homolog A-like isoform X2 [Amphibalanus amphitrite]
MVWRFPWSDSIKKRACRYLLQRYLGQFLKEKLTLEQLSVDIYEGTGEIKDILLDVDALNDVGAANNLPLEFVDGYIRQVRVSIPWSTLLTASSTVEISGLMLTVQAKQMLDDAAMFDSMLDSMSTSTMDMAKECLSQVDPRGADPAAAAASETLDGIEALATAIDTVLLRIKVRFVDTVVRVEHVGQGRGRGVGVELRIACMDYMDEAGRDLSSEPSAGPLAPAALSVKRLSLDGVSLHSVEFPADRRAQPGSMAASFSEHAEDEEEDGSCGPPQDGAEPILLGQFNGRTELRCEVKVADAAPGPKLSLQVSTGAFCVMLGPRQLHDLIELFSGIVDPQQVEKSTPRPAGGGRQGEKPMTPSDYQVIEDQLLRKNLAAREMLTTQALRTQGWSSSHLEDEDEEFLPFLRPAEPPLSASITSMATSADMDTSMTSSATGSLHSDGASVAQRSELSYTRSRPRRRRDRGKDDEQGEDSIRLRLQLGTVCALLLHEDVLVTAPDSQMLTSASLRQMQRLVESGLARLSSVCVAGDGARGTRPALLEACPHSHLSLVAAPTKLECSERPSGGSRSVFSLTLTAGVAELLECLVERRTSVSAPSALYTELLTFETGEPPPGGRSDEVLSEGALTLTVRHSQPLVNRHSASSAVNVRLKLAPCRTEVDISLTDRLATLLNPAPRDPAHRVTTPSSVERADVTKQQCFNAAMDDRAGGGESRVDVHVSAPLVDVQLRIPIPDLRPLSDMDRPSWWQRHVRPDSFHIRLRDASVRSTLHSRDDGTRLELQARHATVGYQETEAATPVVFINVSASGGDSLSAGGAVGLDWPRAVLSLYPTRSPPLLEADQPDGGRDSSPAADSSSSSPFAGLRAAAADREPSPFGRRRVVYETDSHWRGEPDTASEGEELVIPGSREEVDAFVEDTVSNCQTLLELSLPVMEAILPNKRFYELIYNRLATDLALWEPAAPTVSSPEAAHRPADPLVLLTDGYQMCKSATNYDSDSDGDAEASVYESVYSQRRRQRRRQRHQDEAVRSRQSRFCLRLQLGQGIAALQTPCLTEEDTPVPGHHGEVQLAVDSGSLFVASGYGGLYGHGFICLSAHRASLYHKGQMPTRSSPLLPSLDAIPACLDRLVSPYERDPTGAGAGQRSTADMLSVTVQYQLDETNNIKTFTVAVGLDGCALRPRMLPSRQLFVAQLMDMFDVVDFPVAGYEMPGTVTQLHLRVADSALDFRPLSLPYQYLLSVDSFTLSSHLAAATGTTVLRFILEDAALHVADRSGGALADILAQYVCVVEAGLLELSVRKSDAPVGGQPLFDFRCSNNSVQVRTCADSLRALVQLVTYLAAGEGDQSEPAPPPPPPPPTPRVQPRQAAGEGAGLADLMEDAMQEASPPRPATAPASQGPVEVFFFPNEPHVSPGSPPPPPPQPATDEPPSTVMATMAEALADIEDEFDDVDESFCLLDDDPGSGIRSRSGEPQVRVLTTEPIRIVDNFLPTPLSRADVLRAPAHLAAPLRRCTLQQMSVSWSLYGGHDLASTTAAKQARKVRIESPSATPPGSPRARIGQRSAGSPIEVAFSKHGAQQVRFGTLTPPDGAPPPSPTVAARLRGGPGRLPRTMMELRLNKVRCQAEEYPENTEEARRFVLAVQDVEMLDRIATSDINKFLYQYSSESCPRQAHSNMILLKALSRRPDPAVDTEECDVRLSLCPIRLNVDQDALFFLRDFFKEVAGDVTGGSGSGSGGPVPAGSDAPVLSITQQDAPFDLADDRADAEGEDDDDDEGEDEDRLPPQAARSAAADTQKTFFRTFTFSPEVLIRIDYQGKRVDIGQFGPVIGLIIGLGQLSCSEIRLKRISHKSGLLGLDRLVQHALNEWLTDIRRNQLPSVLGGIGPMHSFVQLFQGIRDLVWMPIEQYQKDGRIYKGLQRGANSFTTSTAMAFLELTNRLVGYVQGASEFTYDMLSPGPSMRQKRRQKRSRRRTSNLPQDLREGVTNAYELVKEGLGETAQTLARVAAEEHDQKGVSGAVGGVLRQIPPTMVKPILLASEATSNVLGGMRNQLAPDARREAIDKWKATE